MSSEHCSISLGSRNECNRSLFNASLSSCSFSLATFIQLVKGMAGFQADVLEEHVTTCSAVFLCAISVSIAALLWRRRANIKLPPGPRGLPIVGYLPFLGKEPYRILDKLRKKYGNVFSMYMGRTYVVILGDYDAVKEAFSKSETTDRPPELFSFLPNGIGYIGANGQDWVEQRRFGVKAMRSLGLGRSTWVHLIEEEMTDLLQEIEKHKGQPIDIFQMLTSSMSNNMASLVFGKRLSCEDPNRKILDQSMDDVLQVFTQAGLYSHFPWLVKLMVKLNIGGYVKYFQMAKDFNTFMRNQIELHKTEKGRLANDFVDSFLQEMELQQKLGTDTTLNENSLIGNTQGLFLAGSDTTRTSLSWLLLAMTAYPDVQKKVHIELDSVLGEGPRASWEDRSNLPYTYAVIMEGQRWKTLIPLNTSRIAREDIKLGDFDIPKGSAIIANNWGIHNDPSNYKDPEKFIPERFLQNEGREVNLRPENYVPFSYGKRNCPGDTVAMMEIFLYFAALMQLFEVRTPNGEDPCLDAILGLTYQPVSQQLCLIPRSRESR